MGIEISKLDNIKRTQLESKIKRYDQDLDEARRKLVKLDDRKHDLEDNEDYVSNLINRRAVKTPKKRNC